ncbi:MAG: preprotein translocase subunit SecA [Candidatus Omnitrophica bacterium]|nr:preprotein translocase subunit SecA [Candidatus Omnitrophota bacterium]
MYDFLFRKAIIKRAQSYIDKLRPKVSVFIHDEIPLPSIKIIKRQAQVAAKINAMEDAIARMSDEELRNKTSEFKARYHSGVKDKKQELAQMEQALREAPSEEEKKALTIQLEEKDKELVKLKRSVLDGILPEAFAVVRESGKRTLKMRHFDVQLIGGMVLHEGNIAEMTTGEGKTLVATLPAYLNALTGEGIHIVTVNDYLAKRDREWMGPIYEFLGLKVGVIYHDMDFRDKKSAYDCDIVYGTNSEFGFDYLRDNMANSVEDMFQRRHYFAIVDEVDSILVDEARTPLIISGPAEESTDKYYRANEISKKLKGRRVTESEEIDAKRKEIDLSKGVDYTADEKAKSVSMTEEGEKRAAGHFGIDNLHDMETIEYRHHILQAIKAHEFFKRDVDYVVKDGQVIIVDEFTGRLMPGRRWSDGLHQAVEAKEGIKIERENQTLATITLQNYFRFYEKLAGMTGTAYTEVNEFKKIYNLDCIVIPTNKKLQRVNYPDSIYKTTAEKYSAVVEEIAEKNKNGQPVLVGTISIEKSEILSRMLKQRGITHQVLNAKYHEMEAHIIAQAGRYKAVTIATNMAGRGTDIMLGGNAEYLAKSLAREQLKDEEDKSKSEEMIKRFVEQFRVQVKEEHGKVVASGGLHVIGTERHEARRIDNQLRGRQGRQGDPGSSRFFISLEDDLMRLFASDRIISLMNTLGMEEGQVLEHPWLTKAIETAQKRVENYNFEIRKHLLDFDNVMNKQREVIYDLRRDILESSDVKEMVVAAMRDLVARVVKEYLYIEKPENTWDIEGLQAYLKHTFDYDISAEKESLPSLSQQEIQDLVLDALMQIYKKKEEEFGIDNLRHLERMFLLHTIDTKWKDHLYAMDQIKEGIGLRSYAQRDPLVEYQREGFAMFQAMYDSINQEVAEIIFKIQPAGKEARLRSVFNSIPQNFVHNEISGMDEAKMRASRMAQEAQEQDNELPSQGASSVSTQVNSGPKVGRNEPCTCGSGKKYKKCCGK